MPDAIGSYQRGQYFGGHDRDRAIAAGHSQEAVNEWIRANTGRVNPTQEKDPSEWQSAVTEQDLGSSQNTTTSGGGQQQQQQQQQTDYGQMFADMQKQFSDQLRAYQDQQTQWQQEQVRTAQQQRQEQMRIEQQRHQEMLAAQNRITTSTATAVKAPGSPLAIQPSTGGSAQSAASLGRKPTPKNPVVSGLNIGLRPAVPAHQGGIK